MHFFYDEDADLTHLMNCTIGNYWVWKSGTCPSPESEGWRKEKEAGYPLLKMLREGVQQLPMHSVEERVRNAFRRSSDKTDDLR